MNFYNIKYPSEIRSFKEATLLGLGKDKGLFVPENIPQIPFDFFKNIEQKSDVEIAVTVLYPFVEGSLSKNELTGILTDVFSFGTPVVSLTENTSVLELFHGPTLAFKDVGARFMARCLGKFADKRKPLTVLVATSGDTGSAVAHGFYNVEGVQVVILFPKGKVSPFQEFQMSSLGNNIQAVAVGGTFDDCQALVKQALHDSELNKQLALSSANSINVARFLPQMLYYFFAYKQLKIRLKDKSWVVSVPSGNFGNLTAGLYAQAMGLPVRHFVAANNANDTFYRYLHSAKYESKTSVPTYSNAMDVGDPSNFVRIQELFGNDHTRISEAISGISISDEITLNEIKTHYEQTKYILDPHAAVGHYALRNFLTINDYGTVLGTAHPTKFDDVIRKVIPDFEAPKVDLSVCSTLEIPNSYEAYKSLLAEQ
ncbi:MAG: threonine synthase [Capnocytophaga sp.]|nr:threonine synthase [Capnocytophaga sp.]